MVRVTLTRFHSIDPRYPRTPQLRGRAQMLAQLGFRSSHLRRVYPQTKSSGNGWFAHPTAQKTNLLSDQANHLETGAVVAAVPAFQTAHATFPKPPA